MRWRVAVLALASTSLVCVVSAGTVACSRGPGPGAGLHIVGVSRIDVNGAKVEPLGASDPVDPAGNGKAVCPPVSIAMVGPINHEEDAFGDDIRNGVQLAVDKHNQSNAGCQVQLKPFDSGGNGDTARGVAQEIVDDAYTIGVIGPTLSEEAEASGAVFDHAGLLAASASATSVGLSNKGWRTFIRGSANDGVQGPSVANYIRKTLGLAKTCVVDDGTGYGRDLARFVHDTLGPAAAAECQFTLGSAADELSSVISKVLEVKPDSVFFSGYFMQAAPFVTKLRGGGFDGVFVGADGINDPLFVDRAGDAAVRAVLSCPCAPAGPHFTDDYRNWFHREPGRYSPVAYDLGTIMLRGIDSGAITRPALLDFVRAYKGQGVAGRYAWTPTGELVQPQVWIYTVQETKP